MNPIRLSRSIWRRNFFHEMTSSWRMDMRGATGTMAYSPLSL